jgi:hypothetical protein
MFTSRISHWNHSGTEEVNNALMEQAGGLCREMEKLAKEDDLPSLLNEDDGSTSGDGSALTRLSVWSRSQRQSYFWIGSRQKLL